MNKYLLFFILVIVSPIVQAKSKLDKQAHRGGRGAMPENTIAAMKYALDLGVTLEMDLSFSQDKKVIVSHDNYISSVFALDEAGNPIAKEDEKKLRLYNLNYDEIARYDVGMKPHPLFPDQRRMPATIPLFATMIDSVEAYAKQKRLPAPRYNIEAKLAAPANENIDIFREEFIKSIMDIVRAKKIGRRIMLQSFDVKMLEIVHRDYPKIKISYLVSKIDLENNLKKLTFKPTIYSPQYPGVTKALVDECHKRRIKVIPWTPNTKQEIEKLKADGVDGIITDFPELF